MTCKILYKMWYGGPARHAGLSSRPDLFLLRGLGRHMDPGNNSRGCDTCGHFHGTYVNPANPDGTREPRRY